LKYLNWLVSTGSALSSDGHTIELFSFNYSLSNSSVLTEWAKHFREHYCLDEHIDALKSPEMTRKEHLEELIFPSLTGFGPGIRSGDFAEILVADYIEFNLGYWVPRTRYDAKTIRDESTKGADVIGFMVNPSGIKSLDELLIFESKTQLSLGKAKNILQEAIDDSGKDTLRLATSLHAAKSRLYFRGETAEAERVTRFQNKVESDFVIRHGAFALYNSGLKFHPLLSSSSLKGHPRPSGMMLVVVEGKDLMTLVHSLYERAANEAD
jgi:hypothetical protein